jgi:cellulose synthase/poly-beta-1,6-N-acetylglucosamine synthase-like glycosyltransferase
LIAIEPQLKYVQFVDGDCEISPGWLETATNTLDNDPEIVAVCGWRQEVYPDRSVYNALCNIEWNMGGVGEISSFGGDVMIRSEAFLKAQGYNNHVIAAEDDEIKCSSSPKSW